MELCLALSLVGMHSAAASLWAFMKFSFSSFRVFQITPKEHQICFLVLLYIVNIFIVNQGPAIVYGFGCLHHIPA